MRLSPTKINISYQNQQQSSYSYQPKIIQSGYIIGQPIAFTNQPQLPQQYRQFSPKSSRNRAQTYYHNNNQSIISEYLAPEPTRFPHPDRLSPRRTDNTSHNKERTISTQEYNSLAYRYDDLQKKYKMLQEKYYKQVNSSQKNNNNSFNERQFVRLIERYRQNTLKECNLLIDRARLQIKQEQLANSRRLR